jgi:hypothetical protein
MREGLWQTMPRPHGHGSPGLTRIPPPVLAYDGGVCQDATTSLRKSFLSPISVSPPHRADHSKGGCSACSSAGNLP